MAEPALKMPENPATKPATPAEWRPLEALRREIDQLFEDFGLRSLRAPFGRAGIDVEPFWRGEITWGKTPAVDFVDNENSYVVTAELPGLSEADVDVKYVDGTLTIRGEKKEEKEVKKKDYYLAERRYGSFQRAFQVPNGVEADKIEAVFKNGVLIVTMPKTAEAAKSEKKIAIKQG
ncbi:MAG: Hsp20/alpha crystallin family protein [Xanthobacteraceae bacterium]|nr:Hsp20/alpha crystallin family protein [Xanthobacteraceae bacterium]